jgi:hypothetical protein
MPRKKSVSKDEFVDLVKARVMENEMRELSVSEERDPEEAIPNWDFYVNELKEQYSIKRERKKK